LLSTLAALPLSLRRTSKLVQLHSTWWVAGALTTAPTSLGKSWCRLALMCLRHAAKHGLFEMQLHIAAVHQPGLPTDFPSTRHMRGMAAVGTVYLSAGSAYSGC